MQPTSLAFLAFFLFSLFLYYVIPHRIQRYVLALINLFYVSTFGVLSLIYLLIASFAVYIFGMRLSKIRRRNSRSDLIFAICLFVAGLAIFKYSRLLFPFLHFSWLAPVGISFYTFKAISYCVDVAKGRLEAESSYLNCWLYLSFFPVFTAGPINRPKSFFAQLKKRRTWKPQRVEAGLIRAAFGCFEKVVIADNLLILIDSIYLQWQSASGGLLWVAMLLYSFQIYLDFDAYSNIAIGLSRCLGFKIEENFKTPYLAENISEFWRRWHISLSSWLRDYIYIPLGGNRKGTSKKYRNLIIVFLISGLWHGASWSFVFWGLFHGLLQIVEQLTHLSKKASNSLVRCLKILLNFILVTISWVFFKVTDIHQALAMLQKALFFPSFKLNLSLLKISPTELMIALFFISVIIILDMLRSHTNMIKWFRKRNLIIRFFVYILLFSTFLILGVYGTGYDANQFIYIQF